VVAEVNMGEGVVSGFGGLLDQLYAACFGVRQPFLMLQAAQAQTMFCRIALPPTVRAITWSSENSLSLPVKNTIAKLHTAQGRYKEADKTFRQVLEARKDKLGKNHPDTLESKHDLAVLYKERARYDEAEPLLLGAVKG